MAATLGMLVQENYRFQGLLSPSEDLSFTDVPNGLAALDVVPLAGWVQMAVLIGAHEVLVKQRTGKKPGDFGTGYLGVAMDDESAKQLRALNVEVQNGRLAMLGILGMFASENIHVSIEIEDPPGAVHSLAHIFLCQRVPRFGRPKFFRRNGASMFGRSVDDFKCRFSY